MLALIGANYRFLVVELSGFAKNSDGSIFANCNFKKALTENKLNIPCDKPLPGTEETLPHIVVGNTAFPLGRYLMRRSEKVFNYILIRARRVSENAFGILTIRFKIYE